MRSLIASSLIALAFGSVACGSADEPVAQDESFVVDSAPQYFIVTRQDTRRCMYPMCGGWFVKAVNQKKTTCTDGKKAAECHVNELDATALGLSDEETYELDGVFGMGHALVLGTMSAVQTDHGTVKTIVVSDAWAGQAEIAATGTFYDVALNGVRCITWPCPSYDSTKLNSNQSMALAGVDLAASGASEEAVNEGYSALVDGVLVAGSLRNITGPGGTMKELVANEFYLAVRPGKTDQMCGGFAGLTCDEGQICNIDTPNACNGADLAGTCVEAPQACFELWAPVCGCNGKTYGNDCDRIMAGVQLDHEGECETVE